MHNNLLRYFDPLYGACEITALEYKLITSPEIQRLRYVRMCNINSMLITGASEISRFEHTLGVLRLVKEWCKGVGETTDKSTQINLCAAAILHDVKTGPFGHSMQYILEDNEVEDIFIHDDITHGVKSRYHQAIDLNAEFGGQYFNTDEILGPSRGEVANFVKGAGEIGPLIAGTMDLDNIDNVIRLGYHVGVASSDDAKVALQLASDITIVNGNLEVSESSISLIKRWQEIRHNLYSLLLLDWAEFSAKAMLTRAIELAVKYNIVGVDSWIKTDLDLLQHLEKNSVGEPQEVSNLAKRLRRGDLYFPALLVKSSSVEHYEKFSGTKTKKVLESSLCELLEKSLKSKDKVIIHPILDRKKTDREVLVKIRETSEDAIIGKNSSQLLVGVFFPNNIKNHESVRSIIFEFLSNEGLKDLKLIEDPVIPNNTQQMDLL